MNWVKQTISDLEFPGVSFAIANSYSRWEIDEVTKTKNSQKYETNIKTNCFNKLLSLLKTLAN